MYVHMDKSCVHTRRCMQNSRCHGIQGFFIYTYTYMEIGASEFAMHGCFGSKEAKSLILPNRTEGVISLGINAATTRMHNRASQSFPSKGILYTEKLQPEELYITYLRYYVSDVLESRSC